MKRILNISFVSAGIALCVILATSLGLWMRSADLDDANILNFAAIGVAAAIGIGGLITVAAREASQRQEATKREERGIAALLAPEITQMASRLGATASICEKAVPTSERLVAFALDWPDPVIFDRLIEKLPMLGAASDIVVFYNLYKIRRNRAADLAGTQLDTSIVFDSPDPIPFFRIVNKESEGFWKAAAIGRILAHSLAALSRREKEPSEKELSDFAVAMQAQDRARYDEITGPPK